MNPDPIPRLRPPARFHSTWEETPPSVQIIGAALHAATLVASVLLAAFLITCLLVITP